VTGKAKQGGIDPMGKLVEFPLADGGSVLIEVAAAELGGAPEPVTRGLGPREVAERAQRTFEQAVEQVQPAVTAVMGRLRAMTESPDEVHVEFGLNLHAEAGAFIAAASTTANFTVAVTWKRDQKPAPR
jgi:hypothetical protein